MGGVGALGLAGHQSRQRRQRRGRVDSTDSSPGTAGVRSVRREMCSLRPIHWQRRGMGRARGTQSLARAIRRTAPERRKPKRWDDETIRSELGAFLGEQRTWPSASEFVAAGREDLRNAIKRHGGAAWWARELGIELRPGQDRAPYSEADALTEAKELVEELGYLPGQRKARELGYGRLATHISRRGGAREFARRHELPQPPTNRHRPR